MGSEFLKPKKRGNFSYKNAKPVIIWQIQRAEKNHRKKNAVMRWFEKNINILLDKQNYWDNYLIVNIQIYGTEENEI